ncbi:hypothetical protein BC332_13206 [Capsicum chinense]|nr:hypothetical protein BC332_13206 [Capsicum chinense]
MVYDLLKRRFVYEIKDKIDEMWINYCGMPVCFGWEEFAIVTGLKCYPHSPSQVIPTLTKKKHPAHPKKEKASRVIVMTWCPLLFHTSKNKNLIEALKGKGLSKKHKQLLCLVWFVHNILWARDVNNNINLGLINLSEDLEVDVTATAEEHNMTVDNTSTTSKDEEKVEPVSLEEQKNYPFEGFNISDEALKKLIQLIKDYSEWIANGLLKHHTVRYCQQQLEVFQNEECLINIIKGFSIPAGLPWHLVDEAVVILKERRIRVYDLMSRRRCFGPSSEIQKLTKILPTYLDMSDFLDQKVCTDWSTIEEYKDKMDNPFDVKYVDGIAQQTIDILDYGPFVAEYLSDGLQVPNDGLDAGLLRKIYTALL